MSLLTEDRPEVPPKRLGLIVLVWLIAAGAGLSALSRYANAAGPAATAGATWPAAAAITRSITLPTLVVFLHPQCACSVATVGELARLMTQEQNRLEVQAYVYQPSTEPLEWSTTALRHSAAAIPGVSVRSDEDGVIAAAFGARVSGQTLLYDRAGRLLFTGGITSARGHAGDNAGSAALRDWLAGARGAAATPVFGCLLHGAAS